MTQQTPAILKSYFMTGDFPTQQQFADFIDSSVNVATTSAQSIIADVSALGKLDVTGVLTSKNTFTVSNSAASTLTGNLSVAGATTLANVSANSIKFSSTSGIIGTTTNNDAAAGSVGEYISSSIAAGLAVLLSSGSASTVTFISLAAGDWDVEGNVVILPAGGTTISRITGAINTVGATLPILPAGGATQTLQLTFTTGAAQAISAGSLRLSVDTSTAVYLIARSDFAISTNSAYGFIGARRRR